MIIHYRNKKLQKILTDDRLIKKYYSSIYQGLKNRLTELHAAANLSLISHLPPPRKHRLKGKYDGLWSVDVSKNYRLLLSSPEEYAEDEKNISVIIIEEIADTH
ncbi:MAG: type II toxin-antitoxin system RelE/ParE family toxin [Acholeplasmataceae bacterium]|nr:type II toxin-antitoxin system RelE/ParE family toxin [Acholeplasmataceae bacterium]